MPIMTRILKTSGTRAAALAAAAAVLTAIVFILVPDRAVNQETFMRNEFGVRTFGYTSFIIDPPNGQMPALTQSALARRKAVANQGTFGGGPWDDFDDFTL